MATWIALLRGVNVGGKNRLAMAGLRASLEERGFDRVRTYVQSGNVVMDSPLRTRGRVEAAVRDAVHEDHGLELQVIALTAAELARAAAGNPYPPDPDEKAVHLSILEAEPASTNVEALEELAAPGESFCVIGRVFYLHAPDGVGRSKLAARAESRLGVSATSRNLRTVRKLLDLAAP